MNPYVFLVGCPRSGTTLLSRIANAHSRLAITHETRWIARTFEQRRRLTSDGFVTPELLDWLSDPRGLKPLAMQEQDLRRAFDGRSAVPFADFVSALFDLYGERQQKPLVGDKSPGYVRYVPTLHQLWPRAKFVHIIRDGRDVALSVLDWRKGAASFDTFRDDPITTIAVWWEWYVRLGMEGGGEIGSGLYHELRYESLVAEPERESRALCAFLGIPFDAPMLRFHEGRTSTKPGLSTKSAWLPVTAGLRDWRTQMSPADVLRFEAAAGELLDELGYPRLHPSLPPEARQHAAGIREAFGSQLRARARPVPRAWAAGVAR